MSAADPQIDNSLATTFWERVPSSRVQMAISVVTLMVAALALFTRLGHYALWADEANTALIGEGVWQTGDTSAVLGRNIVAYRGGIELSNLKARYLPPLQYYFVAPFVGIWPRSALAARLPFAVIGFMAVALVLWWLHRDQARTLTWLLTAMAIIGNVSFWLYCRQCRYYSLAIFFSLAIAYLYLHWHQRRWIAPLIALTSIGLLASNYLNYAALYAALGIDWLIWGHRRVRLGRRDLLWLVLPQIIAAAVILRIWNPLGKNIFRVSDESHGVISRIILFYWNWRDMNRCEFGALVIVIAAPILYFFRGDARLLRAPLALFCYVLTIALFSPQKGWIWSHHQWQQITNAADLRYLAPAIPLLMAIGVLAVRSARPGWLAILLGMVAFGTNLLEGGSSVPSFNAPPSRAVVFSTPVRYAMELLHPPSDPYSAASAWINANLADGQSIWVVPDYAAYPLMFNSPQMLYAWQLANAPQGQFKYLAPIHFVGRTLPDYLIYFGPNLTVAELRRRLPSGTRLHRVAIINMYWHDFYRPELFLRVFSPINNFDPKYQAIYVLRIIGAQEVGS
ncbi:MAG: hypothetical protein ABSC42_08615 [Tepidisphaeraceae bacterium]